jgi:DNA (cytosine-5)-methyltransferase 1
VAQPVTAAFKGGQGSGAGGIGYSEHVAPTLPASDGGNRTPTLLHAMAVRRLTAVECERLQGFPDNYTNIPWRKQPESPDGPRYKALGNSWAVPVVRWIGERIERSLA